jgi:hypothetical protein
MSHRTFVDPLDARPIEGPDRLHFALGVMLDDHDLRDEQTYHRTRLARSLKYLFGAGTVAGLRVEPRPTTGATDEIVVRPGLAIDPLGRLVEIPRSACLDLDAWWGAQDAAVLLGAMRDPLPAPLDGGRGVVADVFLRFRVCPRGVTQAFGGGAELEVEGREPARLRDGYELSLRVRSEAALPEPPDTLELAADRGAALGALRTAILDGWREDEAHWREGLPDPLPEHATGQDPRELLLARVLVPADDPAAGEDRPARRADPVRIDNELRRFVFGAGVLTFP